MSQGYRDRVPVVWAVLILHDSHLICFSQILIWNKYINCQVSWKRWEGKPMECQWDQNSSVEDDVPGASCYQSWSHPYLDSHGTVVQVLFCESDLPQLQFTYLYLISGCVFFSTSIFSTNILIAWKDRVVLVRSNHKGDIYHSLLHSELVQFSPKGTVIPISDILFWKQGYWFGERKQNCLSHLEIAPRHSFLLSANKPGGASEPRILYHSWRILRLI